MTPPNYPLCGCTPLFLGVAWILITELHNAMIMYTLSFHISSRFLGALYVWHNAVTLHHYSSCCLSHHCYFKRKILRTKKSLPLRQPKFLGDINSFVVNKKCLSSDNWHMWDLRESLALTLIPFPPGGAAAQSGDNLRDLHTVRGWRIFIFCWVWNVNTQDFKKVSNVKHQFEKWFTWCTIFQRKRLTCLSWEESPEVVRESGPDIDFITDQLAVR